MALWLAHLFGRFLAGLHGRLLDAVGKDSPDISQMVLQARIEISTLQRTQWVDITRQVGEQVRLSGCRQGEVTVYVPHTTAGVTINEHADPDVAADMGAFLDRLVPRRGEYRHAEGNSDAHIKASLMGTSARVLVREGRPWLGQWQGIFFCEFDGPRRREVWLQIVSAAGETRDVNE